MSTVTCKCKNKDCGKLFEARVADRKRGWARFCSKSCKAINQEKGSGTFRRLLNGTHPKSRNAPERGSFGMPMFDNAHQFSNEDCDR